MRSDTCCPASPIALGSDVEQQFKSLVTTSLHLGVAVLNRDVGGARDRFGLAAHREW
jgi:hypothetical protein